MTLLTQTVHFRMLLSAAELVRDRVYASTRLILGNRLGGYSIASELLFE